MKCFILKSGDILPADKVLDIREKDGKSIVKYQKFRMVKNEVRTTVCYDEAIAFRNMKREEKELFGIEEEGK